MGSMTVPLCAEGHCPFLFEFADHLLQGDTKPLALLYFAEGSSVVQVLSLHREMYIAVDGASFPVQVTCPQMARTCWCQTYATQAC